MKKFILACLIVFFAHSYAIAQDTPIEVTADNALEWDRANQTFTANGNAVISQRDSKITAPNIIANYNEDTGSIVIESVIASPDAVLKQPGQTLTADTVTAAFNNGVLNTITAEGNVRLQTENETLTGNRAIYNSVERTVIVTGNVVIEQGQNILRGDRAEFDLNTNVSRLTSGQGKSSRVSATFYSVGE
jgi:lipopolysaccharide export system protein LptA